jgi:hypothetical protein
MAIGQADRPAVALAAIGARGRRSPSWDTFSAWSGRMPAPASRLGLASISAAHHYHALLHARKAIRSRSRISSSFPRQAIQRRFRLLGLTCFGNPFRQVLQHLSRLGRFHALQHLDRAQGTQIVGVSFLVDLVQQFSHAPPHFSAGLAVERLAQRRHGPLAQSFQRRLGRLAHGELLVVQVS